MASAADGCDLPAAPDELAFAGFQIEIVDGGLTGERVERCRRLRRPRLSIWWSDAVQSSRVRRASFPVHLRPTAARR